MHKRFCATIIGFRSTQASGFEDALRQAADSLPITVRSGRSVSDESYPAEVIHAIVLTPKAIAKVNGRDVDTVQSATNFGTCRIYVSDEAELPSSAEASPLDEFIQRTQPNGYREVAKAVISFFREADSLNRRSTPRAFRDMTCIGMFRVLKYLWPISYVFAAVHILNAMTALAGRGAWLRQHAGDYGVSASTFFGAFFIAHCFFVVARNWLFAVRIAKRTLSGFAWGAAGFVAAAVTTAYSVAITDASISRVVISATLAVTAYAFYMYARRIRAECTSLSQLQAAMANPQHREELLKNIGRQRFGHSAFPLFPFRSRSLFVSYMHGSRWSSDTAALVQEWASKHGLEVFFDRSTIPSGSLWRQSLLRAVSECGFFVAVIDGDAPITEWVLAESAYAALLRKSIGKPRILLIVQNARRIAEDNQNPVQLIYLDVFRLPPDHCFGAVILPIGGKFRLTEEQFLRALEGVRPMCLLS